MFAGLQNNNNNKHVFACLRVFYLFQKGDRRHKKNKTKYSQTKPFQWIEEMEQQN